VTAILLGMTRLDALDADAEAEPPDRQLAQVQEYELLLGVTRTGVEVARLTSPPKLWNTPACGSIARRCACR